MVKIVPKENKGRTCKHCKITFADEIEMNLTTKDTKIFMNQPTPLYDDVSEFKKVLVEGTE